MKLQAYNSRTGKTEDVASIDFILKSIELKKAGSKPPFIYREKLDNVILLQEISVKDVKKTDKTTIYVAHKDI